MGDEARAACDALVERELDAIVGAIARAHPRALADNPDGLALIGDAVRRAIRLGLAAGCERAGRPVERLDCAHPEAWERWHRERERSPEARSWPAELETTAPAVVEQARDLLAAAGLELGLQGRSSRGLQDVGAQAAEAGAALARALAGPSPTPDEPARGATVEPVGAVQPDGTVRVAVAANEAEAELLRGVLGDAGIPSNWRRTGGDLPELLAAGYREIYVPAGAAEEAQALLATVETTDSEQEIAPTRRIGLERTGLRLIGKATAAFVVLSILASTGVGFATDEPMLGIAVFLAVVVAGAALVVWSERAGRA